MARAGFCEIPTSKIRFGKDGRWYADDEPILNQRIVQFFSRHLVRQPDGSYRIEVGWDTAPVEVEDTAYVVEHVWGDQNCGFEVELNDGTREPLAVESLVAGAENVLYCAAKGGSERVRFLRSAYYQLAPYIEEAEPGKFVVRSGSKTVTIGRAV